jgi:hypothetical protein
MKVKTLRLENGIIKAVGYRAKREVVDETTAMRQLLKLGIKEYAIQLYKEGKITLQEAADLSNVSIRMMLDILLEHGIKGNVRMDQQNNALEYIMRFL